MTTWRASEPGPAEVDPRPVGDSLDRVSRTWGAPRAGLLAAVFSHWESLVGPEIARHAQPRSLHDGVLVLTVDQPAWAAQLRYLAPELLTHVRANSAAGEIDEVQIRVASPGWDAGGAIPRARRGKRRRPASVPLRGASK